MNISRVVREAIDKWVAGDIEHAWQQAVIAVDATAKLSLRNAYPKRSQNRKRFTAFIKQNIAVVTRCAFGNVTVTGGIISSCAHPDLKPTPGLHPIEEIFYQIRCDLLHEATLSPTIQFTDTLVIGSGGPVTSISSVFVIGLVAAVIVAKANRNGHLPPEYTFNVNGKTAKINDFWGNREECMNWFEEAFKASD